MQVNELKPKHKNRGKKRVGRGGKKGTYSGHGLKGQNARAGRKKVPIIRELIKRYPKLKGYRRFVLDNYTAILNLETLERVSKDGDVVSPKNLIKGRVISNIKGRVPNVKILGTGKLTKKLTVENCKVSSSAKVLIEKAGGTVR